MSVGTSDIEYQSSSDGSSSGGTRTGATYSNAKGAFFPNVADVDRIAGITVTRKWFLYNNHGTDAFISPSVWIQYEPDYCTEEIGLGFDDSDDNDSAQGNMTAWGGSAVAALVSDAADTRDALVYGLDGAGDPQVGAVTLNGTTEVLTTETFSVVYAVQLDVSDVTNTVTVAQGSGGTVRGTIGPDAVSCFLWMSPYTKGTGIRLGDLGAGESYGFWDRIIVPASAPGVRPNTSIVAAEEN